MGRKRRTRNYSSQSFWTAYSDVMAGLLLMFFMILTLATSSYRQERQHLMEQRNALEQEAEKYNNAASRGNCIRSKVMERLGDNLRAALLTKSDPEDVIVMDGSDVRVSFPDEVQFELGQDRLPSEAARRAALRRIIEVRDQFYNTNLANEVIDKIQIVGRADLVGDQLYNMLLSIRRGGSVMSLLALPCELESGTPCSPDQTKQYWDTDPNLSFTGKLTVQGIGQQGALPRPIEDQTGERTMTKDNPEFRRAEIRFITKSDLEVNEIFKSSAAEQQILPEDVEFCNQRYPVHERELR